MRLLTVSAFVAVLSAAAVLTLDAGAARKPTPSERAAVTLAVIVQIPHVKGDSAVFVMRRVIVSTVNPGPRSTFSRFAAAFGVARDESGLYPPGPRTALAGLRRQTRAWSIVAYGSQRVGCTSRPDFFGGRRAAILRDLGIRCT